ncbi:MAG: PHP domain-containing protein [Candidatus Omnitrophota bacterium]|nr:PHP domain-containing protein [Candidatus Omnitrophota bacterium]
MKYADLHIHTNLSDSTYSPRQVVKLSLKNKLSAISITDHDTVDAIEPIQKIANPLGLEIIPGIEMTCDIDGIEIHILGYFIDYKDKNFLNKLKELRQIRVERIHKMVEKLKGLGLTGMKAEEVVKSAGRGAVGRVHLAVAMQKKGYVGSIQEAFYKFIHDKGPAYVSKFRFKPQEVIDLIIKNNGIPVLAHPHTLGRKKFIEEFVGFGLKGIEVFYPEYTHTQTEYYKNFADKFNLLLTGGSDCHGEIREGNSIGKIKIPYELVEKLRQAYER